MCGIDILANEVLEKHQICNTAVTIAKCWTRTTYTRRNTRQSDVEKKNKVTQIQSKHIKDNLPGYCRIRHTSLRYLIRDKNKSVYAPQHRLVACCIPYVSGTWYVQGITPTTVEYITFFDDICCQRPSSASFKHLPLKANIILVRMNSLYRRHPKYDIVHKGITLFEVFSLICDSYMCNMYGARYQTFFILFFVYWIRFQLLKISSSSILNAPDRFKNYPP